MVDASVDFRDFDQDNDGKIDAITFGLMRNSWGGDGSQQPPPLMCPWSKLKLGWINPIDLESPGKYQVTDSMSYRIKNGFPSGEYLLLENRRRTNAANKEVMSIRQITKSPILVPLNCSTFSCDDNDCDSGNCIDTPCRGAECDGGVLIPDCSLDQVGMRFAVIHHPMAIMVSFVTDLMVPVFRNLYRF
jgi:hypothetical protein